MDAIEAIRTRRTLKAFAPDALGREQLDELLELARWAPNHRLTSPWRIRVVGSESLARLKEAGSRLAVSECPPDADRDAVAAVAAAKLDRAPTLVVISCVKSDDAVQHDEDLLATGVAAYIVLLAAHARGFAGYWRTPAVLRTTDGRAAVGIAEDEEFVALLYLGKAVQEPARAPERAAPEQYVSYLD